MMCTIQQFIQEINNYYNVNKRSFSWRNTIDPYHIIVSEIMLQQTQTHRVIPKYENFIAKFPTITVLAQAPLRDVLAAWQGLGYNRRGLALHALANIIVNQYDGIVPHDPAALQLLPGIGKNTAGSICAFAFNKPVVFIETNIRTVFIHFFFTHISKINDKDILPLIEQTVDHDNPREWYYALMDYGVMLKKMLPNPSRASAHHARQSTFEGSDRQIRGFIIKLLTINQNLQISELYNLIDREVIRIDKALAQLIEEGFITRINQNLTIAK